MKRETAEFNIFKLVSVLFFIYFLYEVYSRSSIEDALLDTLTEWAAAVVSTPVPSVSILLGFPIKMIFNLPIYITYLLIAFVSIFILYFYKQNDPTLDKKIIESKMYSIFIISILSSTILTKLLDSGIEYITERKPIQHLEFMLISSTLLVALYAYQVHRLFL